MNYLRILAGITLMLAGVAGVALSLTGIYAVQQVSTGAPPQIAMILDSTQEGLAFLKRGTIKVEGLLADTQSRTRALESTLIDIADKVQKTGKTPLSALEERTAQQFQRAHATVVHLQSSLEGFQNMLVLFNSLSRFSPSAPSNPKGANEGDELIHSLSEASELLDQVSGFLNEFLTDREVTHKSLTELTTRVKQIQVRLADAVSRVDAFRQRLVVTEESVSSSRQQLPHWIEWGGIIAIVALASFGFTQIGLLLQAWSLLRTKTP